jgi:hypothetical protein
VIYEHVAGSRLIHSMVKVMDYLNEDDEIDDAAVTVDDLRLSLERVCAAVAEQGGFVDAGQREHLLTLLAYVVEADPTFVPSLPAYAQQTCKELLPHLLAPGRGIH